jgi:hypothetical protein
MNTTFQQGVEWNWSGGWRQKVTPAMLNRGAAISASLAGVAEAACARLAEIPDDGAEDHTADN